MNIRSILTGAMAALMLPLTAAAAPAPSASAGPTPSPSTASSPSAAPVPVGDLAAFGARVEARTGQTVAVHVGMRNVGNGSLQIIQHGAQGWWTLYFTPPPGTAVTGTDPGCSALDPTPHQLTLGVAPYGCLVDDNVFPPGRSYGYSFDLKVTGGAGRTTGKVRAALNNYAPDSNPANDTALVVVTVIAPGSTASSGPGLPVTGAPTLSLVAAGALLTVAGMTIVVLTHRRRRRTT